MGAQAYIHVRLIALAAAAGGVDAATFLGLDAVFVANQSGNTVLVGVAIGHGDTDALIRAAAAVGAFCLGVLLGSLMLRRCAPGWPRAATAVVLVEALLLAAIVPLWSSVATIALIVLAAIAMGLQSAVAVHVGIPAVTTTFVTGTLTRMAGQLAGDRDAGPREATPWLVWLAYLGGAIGAGVLERLWTSQAAFACAAAVVAAVAVTGRAAARR